MKAVPAVRMFVAALALGVAAAHAQGTFVFNNRVLPEIDARFVLCTDAPGTSSVGAGFQVQLLGGPEGTPVDQLVPLDPSSTTFRTNSVVASGYVLPITVTVPGAGCGGVTVLVRAFDGPSWESARFRWQGTFRTALGCGSVSPPNLPLGTSPLALCDVPQAPIADPALEAAVREALARPTGPLTVQDLLNLRHLYAYDKGIRSLSGLEAAQNLVDLDISGNPLVEVSFPAGLTKLTTLYLTDDLLTRITLPDDLTSLTSLWLNNNRLTSLALPPGLASLTALNLNGNQLTSVTLAVALPSLTDLSLCCGNPLADFSFLSLMPNLTGFDFSGDHLTQFSFPSVLTRLTYADLKGNQIRDLSVPAELTRLGTLLLNYNLLTNLSLPAGLTNLSALALCCGNELTNFSFLETLTNLSSLDLAYNHLTTLRLPPGAKRLAGLFLAGNQLADFTFLSGWTNLSFLDLSYNGLSTLALPQGLTKLSYVRLEGNPQLNTVVLPEQLARMGLLQEIDQLRQRGVRVFSYPATVTLFSGRHTLAGTYELALAGPPGAYELLGSDDLATWRKLRTITNPVGNASFVDLTAGSASRRFYRAAGVP